MTGQQRRGIEQITVKLPDGYDPYRHEKTLESAVAKQRGEGWSLETINMNEKTAVFSRQVLTTQVEAASDESFAVTLKRGTKPSDGDKYDARLSDQYPGYVMTRFDPFLGQATLTRLNESEIRCRGAVSVALGCKPWDVQVKAQPDGGFALELPRTYMPSKHDDKLEEVASGVVGRDGWYVDVDAARLTARIVPSEPPTFPEGIPTPLAKLGTGSLDETPFGMVLPQPGETKGPAIAIDWTASAWTLVAGTPGAGKSVSLNAIIADQLAGGAQLVVVDVPEKAVDFEWCKPFCRPGGWGCDSVGAAVAAIGLVREEGSRRAAKLKELGLNNWLDMSPGQRFDPILVIVDEVSALVVPEPTVKGIPKDHPIAIEVAERNLARAILMQFIRKTIAELRFVGVRMVLSTQATNANTGVDPGLRTLIGHKILQGVNPSKSARGQIFSDESAVPQVPENVKAGGARARGVGVAHLEGQAPKIYKTYFASTGQYAERLAQLGVKKTLDPSPSATQIDKFLPTLDDEKPSGRSSRSDDGVERAPSGRPAREVYREMGDTWDEREDGSVVSGFEKANLARHEVVRGGAKPENGD